MNNLETSKARYYSETLPLDYARLNPHLFDTTFIQLLANISPTNLVDVPNHITSEWLEGVSGLESIENEVKVIPLPIIITPESARRMTKELRTLRELGMLSSLRGERKTDLARPIRKNIREQIPTLAPYLTDLLRTLEPILEPTHLFVRAVKIDEARASTTATSEDKNETNFHFDAEKFSLTDYNDPVAQLYANIGALPRVFTIMSIPLHEMIGELEQEGLITQEEGITKSVETLHDIYLANFEITYEQVIVPSGHLAIFGGRIFAHDAGKPRIRNLRTGEFKPSHEPDIVLALDTKNTLYHEGYYNPSQSILSDPGTPAWWEMMAKYQ